MLPKLGINRNMKRDVGPHELGGLNFTTLNLFIDNDTVIKRLKYGVRPEMGSTKHCKTDYDIWAETIHILDCLPCTSAFTHVKGHQKTTRSTHFAKFAARYHDLLTTTSRWTESQPNAVLREYNQR